MKNKQDKWIWLTPFLLALPFAAGMGLAAARYGRLAENLIHLVIKLVVTK